MIDACFPARGAMLAAESERRRWLGCERNPGAGLSTVDVDVRAIAVSSFR